MKYFQTKQLFEHRPILKDLTTTAWVWTVVIGAAVTFALGIVVLVTGFSLGSEVRLGDLFIAASVLAAVGLGRAGFRRARDAERREHTFNLISDTVSNPVLVESLTSMVKYINRGGLPQINPELKPEGVVVYEKGPVDGPLFRIPPKEEERIIQVLNFYQFLSISLEQGDADEQTLYEARGSAMVRTHNVCNKYINERREFLKDPNIYQSFSRISNRFRHIKREKERQTEIIDNYLYMTDKQRRTMTITDDMVLDTLRKLLKQQNEPVVATNEIAEIAGCSQNGILKRLNSLHRQNVIERKKVGKRSVVWWVNSSDDNRKQHIRNQGAKSAHIRLNADEQSATITDSEHIEPLALEARGQ